MDGFMTSLFFTEPVEEPPRPCDPSPCGQNANCREVANQAVCTCLPGYVGQPPYCKPECVINIECPYDRICSNQKCVNPCPQYCGIDAQCVVKNHQTMCFCPQGYEGDPFKVCTPIPPPPGKDNMFINLSSLFIV